MQAYVRLSRIEFIDDILVYSKTQELHEENLRAILATLRRERLYTKFFKCEFWLHDVHFLGHFVNQNDILVDPAKVEAVMRWEVPRSGWRVIIRDSFMISSR